MKHLSETIDHTQLGTVLQLCVCVFFFLFSVSLLCRSSLGHQQTTQSTAVNISSIEMSVTVATEPLCGVPTAGGRGGGEEGMGAGINGPSVCNGEERGCQPGIWVSGPCPGEEHFALLPTGAASVVNGMGRGGGGRPLVLPQSPHECAPAPCSHHVHEGQWLRRVLGGAPLCLLHCESTSPGLFAAFPGLIGTVAMATLKWSRTGRGGGGWWGAARTFCHRSL